MDFPRDKRGQPPLYYLQAVLNRVLAMDMETQCELVQLQGKTVGIEVTDTQFTMAMEITGQGIRLQTDPDIRPDVCMRGSASELAVYFFSSMRGNTQTSASIEVIGDVTLGQEYQRIMKRFEPDWEEAVSHWCGDTVARKLGNFMRSSADVLHKGVRTLELDISEYLRFESETVPDKQEINEFYSKVKALRYDVERLKSRIAGLG